ncbi:hypothetical protein [uncultured Cohaesibacter sp.]|uniref:hypothetical protein n=1 Tax=uncultured Cohaesibacter sp. TaxID=1002546 RepID=UPI0029307A8C|nr:hypothetical protein [uncultured Cohaesibacter sp.]
MRFPIPAARIIPVEGRLKLLMFDVRLSFLAALPVLVAVRKGLLLASASCPRARGEIISAEWAPRVYR